MFSFFLDNDGVYSKSREQHWNPLSALFTILAVNGMVLNKEKCVFAVSRAGFPGTLHLRRRNNAQPEEARTENASSCFPSAIYFYKNKADCQPRWRSRQRQKRDGPVRGQRSTTEESGGIGDVRDLRLPGVDQSQQPDQYHQAVRVPDGSTSKQVEDPDVTMKK